MRIVFINGSPKVKNSASQVLLDDLKVCIPKEHEVVNVDLHTSVVPDNTMEALANTDAWVFAFPLYVDGIPAHLLSCLIQLERSRISNKNIRIYGIVNCGFYEGIQADQAIRVLKNWCGKTGFIWGTGVGVGGGGSMAMMTDVKYGTGPKAPIDKTLRELSEKILAKQSSEDLYTSVGFPRSMYMFAAHMGWRQMIQANGGSKKDLGKRPE